MPVTCVVSYYKTLQETETWKTEEEKA